MPGRMAGRVALVTNEKGEEVERFFFEPFGARVEAQGAHRPGIPASGVDRGYTGHVQDDVLGLVYAGGRLYDPRARRFLTPDPILQPFGPGQGLNPFS